MSLKPTVPEVYSLAMEMDAEERLHLLHMLLDAHHASPREEEKISWLELEGIAPDLLDGEDAQEWVSRTRRDDTASRESVWRRNREE